MIRSSSAGNLPRIMLAQPAPMMKLTATAFIPSKPVCSISSTHDFDRRSSLRRWSAVSSVAPTQRFASRTIA